MITSQATFDGFSMIHYGNLKDAMELHERLKRARIAAGYHTMTEAAAALGLRYPTYAGHEYGRYGFSAKRGQQYARKFKVSWEWLMSGRGSMVEDQAKRREIIDLLDQMSPASQAAILELARQLAVGAQQLTEPEGDHQKGTQQG